MRVGSDDDIARGRIAANASSLTNPATTDRSLPPPSDAGRTASLRVPLRASVDEVRASVARALGQPGCRARVLVGTSARSRAGAVPDVPEVRAAAADAALTVVGYARVKKKDKKPEPGSAPSRARVTNAKAATNANGAATTRTAKTPPASPGLRAPRNYIRESFPDEQSARGADALADPLAAPVGGHARPESRARASTSARTERTGRSRAR